MSIENEIAVEALNLYIEKISDKMDREDLSNSGRNGLSQKITTAKFMKNNILKTEYGKDVDLNKAMLDRLKKIYPGTAKELGL